MVQIRRMAKRDIMTVHNLMEQLNDIFETDHDISPETLMKTYDHMEKHAGGYINYVAEENDEVIGFISSVVYRTFFHPKGTLLINELAVDSGHRNKSVGKQLLQTVIGYARDNRLNEIEVGTTCENKKAVEFYIRNGLKDESIILGMELNS